MRFLLLSLLFLGCSSSSVTHFQGVAHTHSYHIQVGGYLYPKEQKKIKQLIDTLFEEVNTHYNRWNPSSELSLMNQGALTSPLSPQLEAILHLAHTYKVLTKGRFDPSLGGVIAKWKIALKKGELPENSKYQREEIDLDGMVKGYAIDLLVERLNSAGHQNVCVEWGGDIRTSGHHPSKRAWRILMDGQPIDVKGAIATSGNDAQQWKIEERTFTHIIDPNTKKALEVQSVKNVTVKAPSCALADALATACMTIENDKQSLEWAKEIKQQVKEVEFWIVTKH